MADHLLNGVPLVAGNLDIPEAGAWTADVLLASTQAPAVGSAAVLSTAGTSRSCAVAAASSDYLQCKVRLVAGAGKLYAELGPRDYRGYGAAEIAQDALRDAGEAVGDWTPLPVVCAHWTRSQGPCAMSLRRLLRLSADPAVRWRVEDDGRVGLIRYDYADAGSAFDQLASWGQERMLLLGVNDSTIVPGKSVQAFGARRSLERVLYEWTPEQFTARCWYM